MATASRDFLVNLGVPAGRSKRGPLEVRFVGANQNAGLEGLDQVRRCVTALSLLEAHFGRLAELLGTEPNVRGPVAGNILSKRGKEALMWQYEVVQRR